MTSHTCPTVLPCKSCARLERLRERYQSDPSYRQTMQDRSRNQYENPQYRMKTIENAKDRYQRVKDTPAYQEKERERSKKRARKRPAHTCPALLPCAACLQLERDYTRHKERLQTDSAYRENFRSRDRTRTQKRSHRDGGGPGKTLWIMAVGLLAERDGWICQLCLLPVDWETVSIDHIVPRALKVDHSPANLRLAHRRCNNRRNHRQD